MIRDRKIGLPLATMLVAGNMIGSGIYLLPASLAAIGSISIIGWIITTLGALSIAAVLAHLGRIAPTAGGLCSYADAAFGPFVGFQANVFYWVCAWLGNIAIALGAIGYFVSFFPALNTPFNVAASVAGLIWIVTLINILGPRIACQVQSATLVIGLIPVVLVATAGWWLFDPDVFRASWNPGAVPAWRAIPDSLMLVFWAFVGVESASVGTAVVENPQRNVPLATLLGVLLAAIIYIAACAVISGLLPAKSLAISTAPFADATRLLIGPIAGALVAAMACIKASGTLLGWVLLTAEVGRAAAERRLFPAIFARVDRHGIPIASLLWMAAFMTAIAFVTISPTLNAQFNKLIEMSVLLCVIAYIYAALALWKFDSGVARIDLRYRGVAVVAILFCLTIILQSQTWMLVATVALAAAISVFYAMFVRSRMAVRPTAGDL